MREVISIKRKALRINLDESVYGTFAEIGAGQEVARTFFQVGGASGTVAKTMSAYDMAFSDAIYGEPEGGRYVSASRLQGMLKHEFDLLKERLCSDKYSGRRFFAFADTCSVLNYQKTNEPHAWIGIRFQHAAGAESSEVILHLRLEENDALLQQRTIGGIGVNLLFACYWYSSNINDFIDSLMDNLSTDQVEIDMMRVSGPAFQTDNRLIALMLVEKGFTDGTIIGPDRVVYQPKDILYKKHLVCLRGRFRPVTKVNIDMLRCGLDYYHNQLGVQDQEMLVLSEITLNNIGRGDYATRDFLDRVDILCSLGHTVLISNCHRHDALVNILNRCKPLSIGLIVGILNMIELLKEEQYQNPASELMEYFGQLFSHKARMLVYPYQPNSSSSLMTSSNLQIPSSLTHLFAHLKNNGFLVDLHGYDPKVLGIFSQEVIKMISAGKEGWEEMVPDTVAEMIKTQCLFDYPCQV